MLKITDLTGDAKQIAKALLEGYELGIAYVYDDTPPTTLMYYTDEPEPFEVQLDLAERRAQGEVILKESRRPVPDGYLFITNDDISDLTDLSKYAEFVLDNRVLLDEVEDWEGASSILMYLPTEQVIAAFLSGVPSPTEAAFVIPVDKMEV